MTLETKIFKRELKKYVPELGKFYGTLWHEYSIDGLNNWTSVDRGTVDRFAVWLRTGNPEDALT